MDEMEFLRGIEGERQNEKDLVDGAEHLLRLKKQVGFARSGSDDLELEKEAKIFGAEPPNTIDHAAIPEKTRAAHFKNYVQEKANEEPSGYLRGMGGGVLLGGGMGGLTGAAMGSAHGARGRGALLGSLVGGGLGAIAGAGAAHHDKKHIERMGNVVKNKSYADAMAHHIADLSDAKDSFRRLDEERRHQELLYALNKEADPFCNACKKEKSRCTCDSQETPVDAHNAQSGGFGGEKLASPVVALLLAGARIKTAATHRDIPHSYRSAKNTIKGYLASRPTARAAAIGGATSGAIGAALGAATSPHDRIGGAVNGGVTGAAIGAGGSALHHHLSHKLASAREKTASSIVEHLKDVNPGLVAATGAGALLGGIGTYLSSRTQKDTGKSKPEEELEAKVEAQKSQPERGLLSKLRHRNTELEHGYARAFREHPNKAALLGTISGAVGGYGIGRLAGGLAKIRGGK